MKLPASHPTDQVLIRAMDGELSPREAQQTEQHLTACWSCRARKLELEGAVAEYVRAYQTSQPLPPSHGARALLKANLSQLVSQPKPRNWFGYFSWGRAALATLLLAAGIGIGTGAFRQSYERAIAFAVPDPSLTPGAAVLAGRADVCRESNTKNKEVPVALRRRVFAAYGISRAEPNAYEVDYLITPALGGADDIRNLWPQAHDNTTWNAEVKDALEDHLRELVCGGEIDLATAQHEIAEDWIGAYKRYFHTDRPLQR